MSIPQSLIFLHICCAPCATEVIERLRKEEYEICGFFYNPNIYPKEEYERRLDAIKKLASRIELQFITGPYNTEDWNKQIQGLENEPESGERCKICYRMRLDYAAEVAKAREYKIFTTTLTISPHKPTSIINSIGKEVGERHRIEFLSFDFKKQNGFNHSVLLSTKYELYRQSYCGCKYSL